MICKCKTCGEPKELETEFYRSPSSRSGFRGECKKCVNRKTSERQRNNPERLKQIQAWAKTHKERRSAIAKKYGSSVKGRTRKMYHAMVWRAKHCYEDVEVRLGIEEFMAWALPKVEEFTQQNPGKSPSVDRIDPDGDYEMGNIRILELGENIIRSRYLIKHLGLTPDSTLEEKLAGLQKVVDGFCFNLRMPIINVARSE